MVTRYMAIIHDDFTGVEIKPERVEAVKVEIGGVMVELDLDKSNPMFGSLKTAHSKGRPVGKNGSVRPIKSARSVVKATNASTAAKSTKAVSVTTVEAKAREWAKGHGFTKLPPRLPREVIDAFNAKKPDLMPDRFNPAVVQAPRQPVKASRDRANLDMTEGTRTRVRAAKKAPATRAAFQEANVG
jgi:Asp-tRNA(Asn)/Glu-tRNA(Gln) amidotransferase B subunit